MMETCKEILCLGVLKAPVKQIKFLVSPEKANNGRFVVMSEMVLLSDKYEHGDDATEKISDEPRF